MSFFSKALGWLKHDKDFNHLLHDIIQQHVQDILTGKIGEVAGPIVGEGISSMFNGRAGSSVNLPIITNEPSIPAFLPVQTISGRAAHVKPASNKRINEVDPNE